MSKEKDPVKSYSPAQQEIIRTLQEHPDWRILYRVEGASYQQPDGTLIARGRAAVWSLMQNGGLVQETEHVWTLAPQLQPLRIDTEE